MGTVYKAQDPDLGREVAIKTMSEELLAEKDMKDRFLREARSAAAIQHPNIVTIFELGVHEDKHFIAMELLGGLDLAEVVDHQQKLTRLEDKIKLVTQVCRGLDFAHKRGVIHRDIKPGNIQVLPDGTAKILDFRYCAARRCYGNKNQDRFGDGDTHLYGTRTNQGRASRSSIRHVGGGDDPLRASEWAPALRDRYRSQPDL